MSSDPLVSVVVPVFRAEAELAGAFASVAAQGNVPLELIVVDDGSGDGTADAAERLAEGAAFPASVVRLDENRGAAAARNAGIEAARGDFMAFLDADDRWRSGKLKAQLAMFEGAPDLVMVGCQARMVRNSEDIGPMITRMPADPDDVATALFGQSILQTSCVVVRAEALEKERFDERLVIAEDRDLWFRLAAKGRVAIHPETFVDHAVGGDSLVRREGARRADDLLAAVMRGLVTLGDRMSPDARKEALATAYFDAGESLVLAKGGWMRGAAYLMKAAMMGVRPGKALAHAALSHPLVRAVRRG